MLRYIAKRVFQGIITIIIATLIIFAIMNLAPGDPIIFLIGGGETPPPDVINQLVSEYGLDKSIPERLFIYASKIIRGDLGYSYVYRDKVVDLILPRLLATATLAISTYILITVLSILIAVVASKKPLSIIDRIVMIISTVLFSFPSFYIAQLLLLLFAIKLNLFPSGGFIDPRTPRETLQLIQDLARHLVLPLMSLTLIHLGFMIRVSRVALLEATREDFITTLRAIGMSESRIMMSAVRIASIPILTMANYEVAFLLSGTLLVEMVYSWPGVGTLLYDAILKRDYPLISGIFFVLVAFSVLISIITDLLYLILDPRIRLGKRVEA